MGTSCFPGADAGDMAVKIEDRIAVLMAPRTGFHLAQIADGGGFLELGYPFRPECRRRWFSNPAALVKVVVSVGKNGMFLRVDAHAIEPEELEVFLLLAATAVTAVFYIRQRRKRKCLGERGPADPGHRYRCKTAANPFRQPKSLIGIGFMTFSVALAVTVQVLPAGLHERNGVLVVVQIAEHTQRKLFHDVVTGSAPRPFPRIVQRGQQNPGKDGDDRHNDKKFNQSKILFHLLLPVGPMFQWIALFHYTRKTKN